MIAKCTHYRGVCDHLVCPRAPRNPAAEGERVAREEGVAFIGPGPAPELTNDDLDAVWHRAGRAQDLTMVDFVERALDGHQHSRSIVARSVRDVAIYAEAVAVARAARS